MTVYQDRLPDDLAVCAEAALPISIAEGDDRVRLRLGVVGLHEESSRRRVHTQHVEIIAAHQLRFCKAGRVVPQHAGVGAGGRDQSREDRVLVAQVAIHRVGEVIALIAAVVVHMARIAPGESQQHQLRWVFHRQAAQQRLIEQSEDRRIRADTQRQSYHRGQCETGIVTKLPKCVTNVFDQPVHEPAPQFFIRCATQSSARSPPPAAPGTMRRSCRLQSLRQRGRQ